MPFRQRQSLEATTKPEGVSCQPRRRSSEARPRFKKKCLGSGYEESERDPRNKAHVSGDKFIVDGKAYFHFNITARWPNAEQEDQEEKHD